LSVNFGSECQGLEDLNWGPRSRRDRDVPLAERVLVHDAALPFVGLDTGEGQIRLEHRVCFLGERVERRPASRPGRHTGSQGGRHGFTDGSLGHPAVLRVGGFACDMGGLGSSRNDSGRSNANSERRRRRSRDDVEHRPIGPGRPRKAEAATERHHFLQMSLTSGLLVITFVVKRTELV
jgi:hypothetical protein